MLVHTSAPASCCKWEFDANCSLIENISLVPKGPGSACKEALPRENIEIHICRCFLISYSLKPGSSWGSLPGGGGGGTEEVSAICSAQGNYTGSSPSLGF